MRRDWPVAIFLLPSPSSSVLLLLLLPPPASILLLRLGAAHSNVTLRRDEDAGSQTPPLGSTSSDLVCLWGVFIYFIYFCVCVCVCLYSVDNHSLLTRSRDIPAKKANRGRRSAAENPVPEIQLLLPPPLRLRYNFSFEDSGVPGSAAAPFKTLAQL